MLACVCVGVRKGEELCQYNARLRTLSRAAAFVSRRLPYTPVLHRRHRTDDTAACVAVVRNRKERGGGREGAGDARWQTQLLAKDVHGTQVSADDREIGGRPSRKE